MEVNTILTTDNAIITNKLMKYFIEEGSEFDCSSFNIDSNNSTITYKNTLIDKVSEYAVVGAKKCEVTDDYAHINIPISVSQQSEKNYDVDVFYRINKIENICYDDLISDQTSFFEYTGEYELIDDCQDNSIGVCTINGLSPCDWKIKFLTSGDLILKYITWNIDAFLVGGGGGGGQGSNGWNVWPGGGGGSTIFKKNISITPGVKYKIDIGGGGAGGYAQIAIQKNGKRDLGNPNPASVGTNTVAFGYSANGGGGGSGWYDTIEGIDYTRGIGRVACSGGSGGSGVVIIRNTR